MRALYRGLLGIACCGAFVLNSSAQSLGHRPVVGTEQHPRGSWAGQFRSAPGDVSASAELPDSPGTTLALLQASEGAKPAGNHSVTIPSSTSVRQKTQRPRKSNGLWDTAAAEAPKGERHYRSSTCGGGDCSCKTAKSADDCTKGRCDRWSRRSVGYRDRFDGGYTEQAPRRSLIRFHLVDRSALHLCLCPAAK